MSMIDAIDDRLDQLIRFYARLFGEAAKVVRRGMLTLKTVHERPLRIRTSYYFNSDLD